MQRIPRYVLLIQDLIKHTSRFDEDYNTFREALDAVKKAADFINERKRMADTNREMLKIQKKLFSDSNSSILKDLIAAYRTFIQEGSVSLLSESDKKHKTLQRYFFLFNDMLLITKVKNERYKLKDHIFLRAAEVANLPENDRNPIFDENSN